MRELIERLEGLVEASDDFLAVFRKGGVGVMIPGKPRDWNRGAIKDAVDFLSKPGRYTLKEIRKLQADLKKKKAANYKAAQKAGALKDAKHPLALAAADMDVMEKIYIAVVDRIS